MCPPTSSARSCISYSSLVSIYSAVVKDPFPCLFPPTFRFREWQTFHLRILQKCDAAKDWSVVARTGRYIIDPIWRTRWSMTAPLHLPVGYLRQTDAAAIERSNKLIYRPAHSACFPNITLRRGYGQPCQPHEPDRKTLLANFTYGRRHSRSWGRPGLS